MVKIILRWCDFLNCCNIKQQLNSRPQKRGAPAENAPGDIIHAKWAPAGAFTRK